VVFALLEQMNGIRVTARKSQRCMDVPQPRRARVRNYSDKLQPRATSKNKMGRSALPSFHATAPEQPLRKVEGGTNVAP
jgi:hypothetical protein